MQFYQIYGVIFCEICLLMYGVIHDMIVSSKERRIWKMTRTALVRNSETKNLKIFRADDYRSQSEMAQDLRGNGFRVLKIWNEDKADSEIDNWELLNRK